MSLTPLQAMNTPAPPNRCSVLVFHYVPHSQCPPPHTTPNMRLLPNFQPQSPLLLLVSSNCIM